MRKISFMIGALLVAASASAHDLWLQPSRYWIAPGGGVPVSIFVGHGQSRENWGIRTDKIILLRSMGPNSRVTDLMPLIKPNSAAPALGLRFNRPGTHVLAMQSNYTESTLPGVRFDEFLQEEGLTPAIVHRQKNGLRNRPGTEIYSRRAKALVQVGGVAIKEDSPATKRLGLALEIVPERDPYRLAVGQKLPVRVFYEGKALYGALVKLTNLDADKRPVAMHRTDSSGRAQFSVPQKGKWLLNVVWTKPINGHPNADYQTIFSSLSFGYPK